MFLNNKKLWDVTQCSPVDALEYTYCFHLQVRRYIKQVMSFPLASCALFD
jgi:hypothetical protein